MIFSGVALQAVFGNKNYTEFRLKYNSSMDNVTIYDAFSKYELNSGQAELVARLDKFLSSEDEVVFLL